MPGQLVATAGPGRSGPAFRAAENGCEPGDRLFDDAKVSKATAAGGASGDLGAVSLLYLCMEVAGCPTVCRHC